MPFVGGILVGLGIGIMIFFGLVRQETTTKSEDISQEYDGPPIPSLHAPAPNFKLSNLDGETISLDNFRGKTVLLNFWATWCAPCRLEMPAFQSLFEKNSENLTVIAVNNAEDPEDV